MSEKVQLFRPAAKRRRPARVAVNGPTGSGKTITSLIALRELVGPDGVIGVIDTERDSALDYGDRFEFLHAPIYPPYGPARYIERIRAAHDAGVDGLLIDSLSHGWFAEGGVLDMVDKAKARHGGNKFAAWSEGTPAQNALVDAMLAFPGHLFVTMRSKMDYLQEQDDQGNKTIKKVGMAPVQRDGIEYEFQLVCDIDIHHQLVVSKSRCSQLADVVVTLPDPREMDGTWWRTLKGWLDSGQAPADPAFIVKIIALLDSIDVHEERVKAKRVFVDAFGKPDELTVDAAPDALAWTEERVAEIPRLLQASEGEGGQGEPAGPLAGDVASPSPSDGPKRSRAEVVVAESVSSDLGLGYDPSDPGEEPV